MTQINLCITWDKIEEVEEPYFMESNKPLYGKYSLIVENKNFKKIKYPLGLVLITKYKRGQKNYQKVQNSKIYKQILLSIT